jgi:hypothetical protein
MNSQFGGKSLFKTPKLESGVQNKISPSNYLNSQYGSNRIQAVSAEMSAFKSSVNSGNAKKILTEADYGLRKSQYGSSDPAAGIYGHMLSMLEILNGISNALRNQDLLGEFKKSPKICFPEEDLDVLSVMKDIIDEIIQSYNAPW